MNKNTFRPNISKKFLESCFLLNKRQQCLFSFCQNFFIWQLIISRNIIIETKYYQSHFKKHKIKFSVDLCAYKVTFNKKQKTQNKICLHIKKILQTSVMEEKDHNMNEGLYTYVKSCATSVAEQLRECLVSSCCVVAREKQKNKLTNCLR